MDSVTAEARPAQLRVPTARVALSWWDPTFWSKARPTDFCYGDLVWGLEHQPTPLTITEWTEILWRREELEYDLPSDTEPYAARAKNRFRDAWYDLHLVTSFWQRSETTKSIHAFLKAPGAFAYARAVQDITPEVLSEFILLEQMDQAKKSKRSVQSLLSDKSVPASIKRAIDAMHQSTSGVIGSNGHRRLNRREGVSYTLAWGAPLVFTTPNLADTRHPLLLVVQREPFDLSVEREDEPAYREMTQRLAGDPVGQTIVLNSWCASSSSTS